MTAADVEIQYDYQCPGKLGGRELRVGKYWAMAPASRCQLFEMQQWV